MADISTIPIQNKLLQELNSSILHALESYSNVHRGSGQFSEISTFLYEKSREIILENLQLSKSKYQVLFCSSSRAESLLIHLDKDRTQILRSSEIGLPLGVVAIIAMKKDLTASIPFQPGGGTTKLISQDWVVWAKAPDKFEGGSPPIINVIAFARAFQLRKKFGIEDFSAIARFNTSIEELLYKDDLQSFNGKKLLEELQKMLIGKDNFVPTIDGKVRYINLDNSASTPTFEPIWNTYRNTLLLKQSLYSSLIKEVKGIILSFLNASPDKYEVLFASNTTEAINNASNIFKSRYEKGKNIQVISSYLEHSSNDLPWRNIGGNKIKRVGVDKEGLLNYEEMNQFLEEKAKKDNGHDSISLLAISGASNVLGICSDLAMISKIKKEHGAKVIIDAAQLIAHDRIDMSKYDLDALVFSAHKIYAPFGCGVLVIKKELLNDNQQSNFSDEENIAGIAALGKALILMSRIGMKNIKDEEKKLVHHLLKEMQNIPSIDIYGIQGEASKLFPYKIGVIPFNLKDKMSPKVARELAWGHGIGVRYGCHCAHILVKHIHNVSPNLEKFQKFMIKVFPKLKLPGVFRVSLGCQNTLEDVELFLDAIRIIGQNGKDSAKIKSFYRSGLKELKKETSEKVFSR